MKKRYTKGTQQDVHGVIIFEEYNSNIYQILSFTPFVYHVDISNNSLPWVTCSNYHFYRWKNSV